MVNWCMDSLYDNIKVHFNPDNYYKIQEYGREQDNCQRKKTFQHILEEAEVLLEGRHPLCNCRGNTGDNTVPRTIVQTAISHHSVIRKTKTQTSRRLV